MLKITIEGLKDKNGNDEVVVYDDVYALSLSGAKFVNKINVQSFRWWTNPVDEVILKEAWYLYKELERMNGNNR